MWLGAQALRRRCLRRPASGLGQGLIPRRGLKIEIVKRIDAGFKILPKRWVVERTFAWLARYRRLAKDYEKTKHSEATTYIASCKSCSPSL